MPISDERPLPKPTLLNLPCLFCKRVFKQNRRNQLFCKPTHTKLYHAKEIKEGRKLFQEKMTHEQSLDHGDREATLRRIEGSTE